MTSKEEISIQLADLRKLATQLEDGLASVQVALWELPDTEPAPPPAPTIQRDIQLLGEPKPTLEIPPSPGSPYYAIRSIRQIGPANVISINVLDVADNPVDGVGVWVGVEDTEVMWEMVTGSKGAGRCEIPYDRKRFWVRCDGDSDAVRNITTDVDMPENSLDMVNGHINLEITYQLVTA